MKNRSSIDYTNLDILLSQELRRLSVDYQNLNYLFQEKKRETLKVEKIQEIE